MVNFEYMQFYYDWCQKTKLSVLGCEEDEILEMEFILGFQFPLSYKEFLMISGKQSKNNASGFGFFHSVLGAEGDAKFEWSQKQYRDYVKLTEDGYLIVEGILDTKITNYKHTGKEIVMAVYEDYHQHFISAMDGNNPPVYSYDATCGNIEKISNTFTEFALNELNGAYKNW